MRIVIDTNVFISGLIFDGVPERVIKAALSDENNVISSSYIINETSRNLNNKFKINPHTLKLYQQVMNKVDIAYFDPYIHVLSDEDDNRILETAVKGKADYIVTGDKLLLDLKNYKKIKIIKPADFLSATKVRWVKT